MATANQTEELDGGEEPEEIWKGDGSDGSRETESNMGLRRTGAGEFGDGMVEDKKERGGKAWIK